MTDATPEHRGGRAAPRRALAWIALASWVIPVVAWLLTVGADVPIGDGLKHLAYLVGAVCLPGTVLLLAVAPGLASSWPARVALGSAVGLVSQLVGLALAGITGLAPLLVVWPAVVLTAGAVTWWLTRRVPRRAAPTTTAIDLGQIVAALVTAVAVVRFHRTSVLTNPLPRGGDWPIYPDLLHHLSIIHALIRGFPPETPQVTGVPLSYHWFSHAHIAAAAEATGSDPLLVLMRWWIGPMVILLALATAGLVQALTQRAWAVPLAVSLVSLSATVDLWHTGVQGTGLTALSFLSPSETLAAVTQATLLLALAGLFAGRNDPRQLIGSLAVVTVVAALGAGTKPSVLAPVVAALLVTTVWLLIRRQAIGRLMALVTVVLGLVLLGGQKLVAGSSDGNSIRPGGFLRWLAGYQQITKDVTPNSGGLVPAGLEHLSSTRIAWVVAALLSLVVALAMIGLSLVAAALAARRIRPVTERGPASQAGVVLLTALTPLAATGAYAVIDHPAAAQNYFLGTAAAAAVCSAVALAAHLLGTLDRAPRVIAAVAVAGGLVLGGVVVRVTLAVPPGSAPVSGAGYLRTASLPVIGAGLACLVAAALGGWALSRSTPERRLSLRRPEPVEGSKPGGRATVVRIAAGLLCVAVLAMPLAHPNLLPPLVDPIVPAKGMPVLSAADVRALAWLRSAAAPDDIVATSTYCEPPRRIEPGELAQKCSARGFQVSGYAGLRTYLEGWAYTSESYATQRVGVRYTVLPSPWPDRLAATNAAVFEATPEALTALRAAGVTWLYVDRSVPAESKARLRDLQQPTYAADGIECYRIG